MNDTNILEIFEEFRRSDHCPISVNIALERAKHKKEMRKKGFKEPIGEEIEESQNIDSDLDQETKDLVNLANNLSEQSNIFDSLEQQGLDIGREYDWCKRFHEVSSSA
jgi:DNA-directed RNA polymerase specialized sigma subunit